MDFEVLDLGACTLPEGGERAPGFERPFVTTAFWEDRTLADVAYGRTVLVFTPMVGSFVARYLGEAIGDSGWLERADTTVVGVSVSTPFTISRFLDRHDIETGLFSDPRNEVARSYEVVHDLDGMAGLEEPRPAVFVLGEDLTVETAWAASEWPSFPPYEKLLAD